MLGGDAALSPDKLMEHTVVGTVLMQAAVEKGECSSSEW